MRKVLGAESAISETLSTRTRNSNSRMRAMNVQVEPRIRNNWGRVILGAVLLLMAYSLLQVAPVFWGEIKKVLPRETRAVQTGPSASWADMWALAKQEAT